MSRSLRYENSAIIDHLASQYVSGVMTSRVRRRTESLRKNNIDLDKAIHQWSHSFAELHEALPMPEFSSNQKIAVWKKIEEQTQQQKVESTRPSKSTFWENLFVWRGFGAVSLSILVLLGALLWLQAPPESLSPAYLASMSPTDGSQSDPVYVVSVYKGTEEQRPQLFLQWVKNTVHSESVNQVKKSELHIWSEDRETQQLVYIGLQPKAGEPLELSKAEWMAIENSQRLLVSSSSEEPNESTVLFSGLCLQLKSWKA